MNALTKICLLVIIYTTIPFNALGDDDRDKEYEVAQYRIAQNACYEIASMRATAQTWQGVIERCLSDRGFKRNNNDER